MKRRYRRAERKIRKQIYIEKYNCFLSLAFKKAITYSGRKNRFYRKSLKMIEKHIMDMDRRINCNGVLDGFSVESETDIDLTIPDKIRFFNPEYKGE